MPAHVHRLLSRAAAFAIAVAVAPACKGESPESKGDASTTTSAASSVPAAPRASAVPSLAYDPLPLAPPAPRPSATPVASWTWKTHQGDGFSVSFPGEPKITELPADEDRVGFTEAKVDMPGGQVSFAAGYSDHPASAVTKPETFLDEKMSTPRRGTTEVLHKRAISLGPNPGRVLILKRNISGTPLRVYSRLYLVGRRLYSLIVSTLDAGGVGEDVVKRFMDSFTLTAGAPPRDH